VVVFFSPLFFFYLSFFLLIILGSQEVPFHTLKPRIQSKIIDPVFFFFFIKFLKQNLRRGLLNPDYNERATTPIYSSNNCNNLTLEKNDSIPFTVSDKRSFGRSPSNFDCFSSHSTSSVHDTSIPLLSTIPHRADACHSPIKIHSSQFLPVIFYKDCNDDKLFSFIFIKISICIIYL
jgi:hypothetical protein